MFRTMRGRIAATLAVVAALSVAVTALVAFGLVSRFARDEALRQLRRDAAALAIEARAEVAAGRPIRDELRAARRLVRASGGHFAQVTPRGIVLTDDDVAMAVATALGIGTSGASARREGTVEAGGTTYAYVFVPAPAARGAAGILLARPASLAGELVRPVVGRVALAGVAAVLVALAASAWIARRMAARVRRLSSATASIAAGDLSHRVEPEGADEIADLAVRFNAMASSLSEARRREHEFLASVSHELRTPITAIRGYAEALADGTVASSGDRDRALSVIEAESGRLERLVQDVIDLARLGAHEFRLEPAPVDLAPTLRDAADAHAATAEEAGVALEISVEPALACVTDAARVRQVISNLVENALRITPSGGAVRMTGRTEAGGISIEVSDTGPGIAASDLGHVFERSYLWNAYRGERPVGNGLGLAIVRELAAALGGRIDVASEIGTGTTFRLWLPANAAVRP